MNAHDVENKTYDYTEQTGVNDKVSTVNLPKFKMFDKKIRESKRDRENGQVN